MFYFILLVSVSVHLFMILKKNENSKNVGHYFDQLLIW